MASAIQRSFSSGEIAPALYARVDLVKYTTGLRTCRNFMVMKHGGVSNRPGTSFVGEVKDSTKATRLIPFVFNDDQTYILEFGNQYMRVIRDGAQVTLSAQNITAITNANPCVLTYSGSDTYANGDEVYISGITGAIGTYLNGRNFKVANVSTGSNTFELNYLDGTPVNSTSFGSYTSGGTVAEIYTITTPYLEADLFELQYVQSADVITIVHNDYAPRELARTGHTSWTLSTITFAPSVPASIGISSITGTAGAITLAYAVTGVDSETGEESLAVTGSQVNLTEPATATPATISWSAIGAADYYNVYRTLNGVSGFIGTAIGTTFIDDGIDPDFTDTPPTARNPFNSSSDYPAAVTYSQQRLGFANTINDPEKCWLSRTGLFKNFTISSPLQDDDAITFSIVSSKVNQIRHMIELQKMVILTSGGEFVMNGDGSGILKPTSINPQQQSYYGSAYLKPIIIGGNALYVQARGSIIRDLGFDFETDGYRGNDLTVFAVHLFAGYMINDWTIQLEPNSIVWAVRDDGTLLGLTYLREHQVLAWHRHDFDGTVESVCAIPEGTEDALYLVINRTINGATKRYIERMHTRFIDDIRDLVLVDCSLTYDGTNSTATTMTLSGGSSWVYTETLTLTASSGFFVSSDVGNEIFIYDDDGEIVRCEITAYTSATVVSVRPNRTVPAGLRGVATDVWSKAVDSLTGLWHLEGKQVSVIGDGYVVASPNNESYTTVTVTNGSITLEKPYAIIHVGLPITSDMETLDLDTTQGETLSGKRKNITHVTAHVEKSKGMFVGPKPPTDDDTDPLEGLIEVKGRSDEPYDDPPDLMTGEVELNIRSEWNSNGRIFIRQVDPVPLSVLAVVPTGFIPYR